MLFHMLRQQLGDEQFTQVFRDFYAKFRGTRASWSDIRQATEAVAGRPFSPFFDEWLTRPGAPAFEVRLSPVVETGGAFIIRGSLAQVQGGPPYSTVVPVAVQTAGGFVHQKIAR